LAAPPAHGFGLLAWVMPFLAVGVGLLLMLSWLQAHRPPSAAETRATGAVDVALRARFESELRDFDHRT
jgi:cytochrome c-type biogenesis protein CcmH/NrfF